MADIAFFNFPAIGHINPNLGLVEELVKRGHHVTCTTTDYFVPAIESLGATPVRYESVFGEFYRSPYTEEALQGEGLRCLEDAVKVVEVAEKYYGDQRPDVIVNDFMAWGGRFYGSLHDIPGIRLFPSYGVNEHFSIQQRFPLATFEDAKVMEMIERLTALLPQYKMSGTAMDFVQNIEKLGIIFMPREFHYDGDTFDERFVFAGPCIGDRATFQGSWSPRSDRPVLLISLGTAATGWPEFFRTAVQAFGDSGWDVVMAVGDHLDSGALTDVPDNIEVRRHVPQLDVLHHAALFVTHGGMNSTIESLYFGVPMVVIPQMNEQKANGMRVEELGLGRHLDRADTTVESLRAAVDAVAGDAAVAGRLAAMRDRIRAVDGPKVAADAVENHLANL